MIESILREYVGKIRDYDFDPYDLAYKIGKAIGRNCGFEIIRKGLDYEVGRIVDIDTDETIAYLYFHRVYDERYGIVWVLESYKIVKT